MHLCLRVCVLRDFLKVRSRFGAKMDFRRYRAQTSWRC
jgi:hypothetical protein